MPPVNGVTILSWHRLLKAMIPLLAFSSVHVQGAIAQSEPHFEWTTCRFDTKEVGEARLRCGYLTVPQNRATATAHHLRLAVAVAESKTPEVENDPVVFLNGGPGGRSLPEWISRTRRLVGDRTVVVFDYRGAGASEPDMCPSLQATLFNIRALDQSLEGRRAVERGAFLACRDAMLRQGVELGAYNPYSISADLEDLRRALGYERWSLMGGSYGTRVALTALRTAPESIRSVILVSPVSQRESHVVRAVPNIVRTLDLVFNACAADPSCERRFPHLEHDFYEAHADLAREPLTVRVEPAEVLTLPFTVNAADYIWILSEILDSEATLPLFPLAVHAFRSRDSSAVRSLLQQVAGDPSQHRSLGLMYAAHCYWEGTSAARVEWEALAEQYPEPLRDLGYWLWMCDDLHRERASAAERAPIRSGIPTLIVSGELDYRTPPSNGEELERAFSKGYHFEVPGLPHFPGPRSLPCIGSMIRQFLAAPETKPDGACIRDLPEIRFVSESPNWW